MNVRADSATTEILRWTPRFLGLAVAAFLALFALDAFSPDRSMTSAVLAFAAHSIPSVTVVAIVAAGWRRPRVAGIAFLALAAGYAIAARRLDWIAAIALPLAVVGVLFLLSRGHLLPRGQTRV